MLLQRPLFPPAFAPSEGVVLETGGEAGVAWCAKRTLRNWRLPLVSDVRLQDLTPFPLQKLNYHATSPTSRYVYLKVLVEVTPLAVVLPNGS